MSDAYFPIPIVHLQKHEQVFGQLEIHVHIGEKYVKLNFSEEPYQDILAKLHSKNVEHVYLNEEHFSKILSSFEEFLALDIVSKETFKEEIKASSADALVTLSRDYINRHGATHEIVGCIKEANKTIQAIVGKSPTLLAFFKNFRQQCSQEFLKITVTNYLTSKVIAQFPWKSQDIIEKTMLAGMFCDITLTQKDFFAIFEHDNLGSELSPELKRHPHMATKILMQNLKVIPQETLTIIEQHHEKPDGSGYPAGIEISRFSLLSAIFIVCQRYTDLLFFYDFDEQKRFESLDKIRATYHGGVFTKALDALTLAVEK